MDDSFRSNHLYRWKRQTPKSSSRTYSRSQNCKTSNDIQDWIKRVEQASDHATEVVLGTSHFGGGESWKHEARHGSQQVCKHDQVITEAQELLNNWMQEKLCLEDAGDDDVDNDAVWKQTPVQAQVKREWDRLLGNNDWEIEVTPRTKVNIPDTDVYEALDYSDEEEAVGTILSHMMNKQVVDKNFLQDVRLDPDTEKRDPRLKMELRHKQVKENREKREKQLERKRKEQQEKKDSLHKAKQMVLKEERSRELKLKREEQEIRKEMAHIRKEMETERKKQQEIHVKELRERQAAEYAVRQEMFRQMKAEENEEMRRQQTEEEHQKRQLHRQEQIHIKQEARWLKCLQRHFSAWYGILLERRLQMGKARAMSDWRMLLRVWNAWRSYTRRSRLDAEARQFEQTVVIMHRKQQEAEHHYHCTLLKRCMAAWQNFVKVEQDRRHLEREQSNTRTKMLALLDAAATGKLWTESKEGAHGDVEHNSDVIEEDLDDFFQQTSNGPSATNHSKILSSKSDSTLVSSRSGRSTGRVPTQAWQVTRKHVKLTNEEIVSLAGGDMEENAKHSETKMRRRFGKQPWMDTHYVVNNFENRYTAQQKLLQEQQKQIKDQRRMIEELQFHQSQQNHLEDIARQQLIQQQLTKHGLNTDIQCVGGAADAQNLNNVSNVGRKQGTVLQQQHNKVIKEKQTNVAMETARSDTNGQLSGRTDASNLHTARTATSTGTNKYLQVLKNMEERACERKRLKAEREARKKQEEEERLAALEAQETEMRKQIEEEKKAQAATLREKRKQEKQREFERNKQFVRLKELTTLAEHHYVKCSMKYRGIMPLKKLVAISRSNHDKAEHHYNCRLLRQVLLAWHGHAVSVLTDKMKLADEMSSFLAVKRCFECWKLYKHHQLIEMEKARRHYQHRLLHKFLQAWADIASEEKFATWEKERIANEHYLWMLKKRMFSVWKSIPEMVKQEADREKRRNEMRKKVAHLLPDFEGFVKTSSELL